MLLDKEGDF